MDCTFYVGKTKALISYAVAVTSQLFCVFVSAYAKSLFSHDVAHLICILFSSLEIFGQLLNEPLISAFDFATRIVQALYFLYPRFQASSHLLWLYSPVCVRSDQKPRRPVFSQQGSNHAIISM